ncbi:MAG: hypothetical protein IPM97_01660 [Bdellovibrionaceae bacterium]|nr:hypothetical protein [Pseudobdellovibrionaceae bacterium]
MKASEVLAKVTKLIKGSDLMLIHSLEEIPKCQPYLYLVINGDNVLQIGSSDQKSRGRLAALFRGVRPQIHNKSFIVGIAENIFGYKNEFYLIKCDEAKSSEKIVHAEVGISTNRTAATILDGKTDLTIAEVHKLLIDKYLEKYRPIDKERKLISDLQEKLKSGIAFKRKNGKKARYRSGDILAGSNLFAIGRLDLADLWQRMNAGYFKYTERYLGCKASSPLPEVEFSIDQDSENEELVEDLSESIIICYRQFVKAKEVLKENPNDFVTNNINFQTNNCEFVFEIEKPNSNKNKIDEILNHLNGKDLEIESLVLTGSERGNQYYGLFGGCYLWNKKPRAYRIPQ